MKQGEASPKASPTPQTETTFLVPFDLLYPKINSLIMKIKTGFELRDVCGEKVIIATGIENIDFSRMISLNESAAFLWENIQDKEFDAETLAELLLQEYEVDKADALADSQKLLNEWLECGIIE